MIVATISSFETEIESGKEKLSNIKDSLRLKDERTFDGLPDLVHQVLRDLGTQLSGLEILHYLRDPRLVSIGGKVEDPLHVVGNLENE